MQLKGKPQKHQTKYKQIEPNKAADSNQITWTIEKVADKTVRNGMKKRSKGEWMVEQQVHWLVIWRNKKLQCVRLTCRWVGPLLRDDFCREKPSAGKFYPVRTEVWLCSVYGYQFTDSASFTVLCAVHFPTWCSLGNVQLVYRKATLLWESYIMPYRCTPNVQGQETMRFL